MDDKEFIAFCRENKDNPTFLRMLEVSANMEDWLVQVFMSKQADYFKKEFKERSIKSLKMQQEYFYDSGVCCFIMGKKKNPINNTLMWGHYGDGLKGYVLGLPPLPNNIFEDRTICIPVEYKKKPPRLNATELTKKLINKKTIDNIEFSDLEILIKIVNTKHKRWKYENELRFISHDNGNKLVPYKKGAIKSVFIGEKMPSEQKAEIIKIATKNNVENIYEAYVNNDSYSVSFKHLVIP